MYVCVELLPSIEIFQCLVEKKFSSKLLYVGHKNERILTWNTSIFPPLLLSMELKVIIPVWTFTYI